MSKITYLASSISIALLSMGTVNATYAADGFLMPDGKTTIKPYGFIRGDMLHDFKAAPPAKFSDLDKQPLDNTNPDAITHLTQYTADTTRLGLDFKTTTDDGDLSGKIEGDLFGNGTGSSSNATFRMRHAYLSSTHWLVGHTWSPFTSVPMLADVVDWNAPVGTSLRRKPQVRYTTDISKSDTVMVAFEEPESNSRLPIFTARAEHKTDAGSLANIRLMAQEKRNGAGTEKATGYGIALGGLLQATKDTKLIAQISHIKGGGGGFAYGDGSGSNTVNNIQAPKATEVAAQEAKVLLDELDAAVVSATQQFTPKVRGTLVFSMIDFKDSTDYAKANQGSNKKLQQVSINTIYNPVKSISLGIEYTYGKREVFNGDSGKQSHLDLMAKYSF